MSPAASDQDKNPLHSALASGSQTLLEQIALAIPDLVYIFDLTTFQIVYVNQHLSRVMGHDPEILREHEDNLFQLLMHPDDLPNLAKQLTDLQNFGSNTDRDITYRLRHADGSYRWLQDRQVSFKQDAAGQTTQILGIAHDITNQKEAEENLRLTQERYRILARSLPDMGVLMFDHDLRYNLLEGSLFGKLGYINKQTEGRTLFEVAPPQVVEFLEPFYRAALRGEDVRGEGGREGVEYRFRAFPLRDSAGQITGGMLVAQDITEEKQTAQALRESQNFRERITTSFPDVIYIFDLVEHVNVYANRQIISDSDFSAEEIQAMGPHLLQSLIHPEDLAHYHLHMERLLDADDGEVARFEYRVKTPDDVWHWYSAREVVFTRDEKGVPRQIMGVVADITLQRQAEDMLIHNHEIYRELLDGINDAIIVHDQEANILAVNEAASQMLGYSRDELLQMKITNIDEPQYAAGFPERLAHQLEYGQLNNITGYHIAKDGRHIPIDVNSAVINYRGEKAIMSVVRDMTMVRESEQALRESEERFRQFAENIRSIFWMFDVVQQKMIYLSPAFEEIYQMPREVVYKNPERWVEAAHPDDQLLVATSLDATLQTGFQDIQYRIVLPDGSIRSLTSRAFPIHDRQGRMYRLAGIAEDITHRRALETAAFELALERENMRLLSTFMSSTSHELRTPLSVISTTLFLLRKTTDPIKQIERIDTLDRQVDRLVHLIGEMQTLLKLDSLRKLESHKPVALNRVILALRQRLQPRIEQKQLNFELNLESAMPIIEGDEGMISTAVLHILENAVHFTPEGGHINITTSESRDEVTLEISDSGVGIAPNDFPHIFERFYKADKARTAGESGAGLGLATTRRILDLHGGRIEASSTLGEGTTFRLHWPIHLP